MDLADNSHEGFQQFDDALGLEHFSETVANLHGQYSAKDGHYFTLRDFAKLPHAMANGGVVDRSESFLRFTSTTCSLPTMQRRPPGKMAPAAPG